MLVSVIIPTYNRAELLERAVRSVLAQTYPDFEVIIVDDASVDDTRCRMDALQLTSPQVRLIRHDANRGAQVARNSGIREATGEYIAFLDSDNEWLPRKLERQMSQFSHRPESLGAVYCGYWEVSASGDLLNEYQPRHRGLVYRDALRNWLTDTSTLVVRRDILERIHGLDENVRAYQEWDLCIRLARECEFDFVTESLVIYHRHALPSISKDRLRDACGYLGVVDTYREDIMRQCGSRALSEHYLRAGRLFVLADRFELARTCFSAAVRCYPLEFKSLMHFGASLLGQHAYNAFRALNRATFTSPFHSHSD